MSPLKRAPEIKYNSWLVQKKIDHLNPELFFYKKGRLNQG